jgi:enoyl-CoA hydratase
MSEPIDATRTQSDAPAADIRIETRGSLGQVTFTRPRALNALTTDMRARLAAVLPRWARDPNVYAMTITGEGRAFSAGGDVRELTAWGQSDRPRARAAFAAEYRLNWALECFTKPTVSLIDGAVMGSGVGISLYGTHRVAGENYKFAMPETAIGLFPDVGVVHAFARMPREIGVYLALTGRSIGRADAFALGLVTHCIEATHYETIRAELAEAWPVDPLLDQRHADPGPAPLFDHALLIERCFSAPTVPAILARLEAEKGEHRAFAEGVAADLAKRSPLSLAVTLRHVRQARGQDLSAVLETDYRLACAFLEAPDFYEGVRAALIDKDGAPRWQPAQLSEVSQAVVDRYFAPREGDELGLIGRADMQLVSV